MKHYDAMLRKTLLRLTVLLYSYHLIISYLFVFSTLPFITKTFYFISMLLFDAITQCKSQRLYKPFTVQHHHRSYIFSQYTTNYTQQAKILFG